MTLTQKDLAVAFNQSKSEKVNAYLIPNKNILNFLKDELLIIRAVSYQTCSIFRTFDGKNYEINLDHLSHFKLIT